MSGTTPALLALWKDRLDRSLTSYAATLQNMDRREALYRGTRDISGRTRGASAKGATHVRNVISELIEAQVDSGIPKPKVTAVRKKDEHLAKLIEDMLRNELDRLEFEKLNDQQERTTPIQGGSFFFVEWDSTRQTHASVGELTVSLVHPKQFVPQDGVYTGIESMDFCILAVPQTKAYIQRRYGVSVDDERETAPEIRGYDVRESSEDIVTMYVGLSRNNNGGIDRFSWINDTPLEFLGDYQKRRLYRCGECGTTGVGRCPACGKKLSEASIVDEEELDEDIKRADGSVIPKTTQGTDENGRAVERPTKIPFYQPNLYPFVLRKNVSVFGQLLGDSDVDKISDQQNTIKKLSTKIGEKLLKGGSYITFPNGVNIEKTDEELKIIRIDHPAQRQSIDVFNVQPNISGDLAYQQHIYEEARQIIGVTESFQGRKDSTATSGKAKEFAAAQTMGRLESKRVLKHAAYAELFRLMFAFKLAYSDEPRPVVFKNMNGKAEYAMFDRYAFLEKDEAGQWYWNDEFLFSCDTSAALAGNREGMWQETRLNLERGAFGNPAQLKTLILFWTKMEELHYPGASDTKAYLERELENEEKGKGSAGLSSGKDRKAGAAGKGAALDLSAPAGPPEAIGGMGLPETGGSAGGGIPPELLAALSSGL